MENLKHFLVKIKNNSILMLSDLLKLVEWFLKKINLNTVKETLKIVFLCLLCGICYNYWVIKSNENNYEYEYAIYRSQSEMNFYMAKNLAVQEINNYIDSVAPTSSLHGVAILEACDKYDIDIVFVMAQAQLESHFGTTGVASKTNSVWNVMAWDGRTAEDMNKNGHGYEHPDFSIVPYMKLLQGKYLSEKVTEYDLLCKFEDKKGHRYASNKNYEKQLMGIYNRIMENTNIFNKFQEYKKYKMILQVKL